MDFTELMEKRRSIRNYEDKEVSTELIQEIINDSITAPSAGNMQLWRFIIVQGRDWLKKISDSNKAAIMDDIKNNPNSGYKGYEAQMSRDDFNIFYNAPAAVYIIGTKKSPTVPMDCALAASYFMLSATSRGLGTCWVAQGAEIRDDALREELGIPENYRMVAPIIIGYPKSIPPMPARKEAKILNIVS